MTQQDADRLIDALVKRFGGNADAEQAVPGQFRFTIVSPGFSQVPHLRRQDQAWEVVNQSLSREQILDLTLVLTLAPEDLTMPVA